MATVTAITVLHVKRAVASLGMELDVAHGAETRFEDRLPVEALIEVWERAATTTGRRELPAIAARCAAHDERSLLAYVVSNQRCFGDAMDAFVRYFATVSDAYGWRVEHAGDALHVIAGPTGPVHRIGWQLHVEFEIADVVRSAAAVTAGEARPRAVNFLHGRPPAHVVDALAELVGVEPGFDRERCEVVYPASVRELVLPQARPPLGALVEARLQQVLALHAGPISTRVRTAIGELLERGAGCDVEAVAAALGMGRRTLERTLAAEGTSARALLDEERKQRALAWLPALSVDEVAARLGYSDRRAFARAFRRWTGAAPREARGR